MRSWDFDYWGVEISTDSEDRYVDAKAEFCGRRRGWEKQATKKEEDSTCEWEGAKEKEENSSSGQNRKLLSNRK